MRLSTEVVSQLRQDRKSKLSYMQLATKYGISNSTAHKYTSDIIMEVSGPTVIYEAPPPCPKEVAPEPALKCPVEYQFSTQRKRSAVADLKQDHDFQELYWQYRDYIGWKDDPKPFHRGPQSESTELNVVVGDLHVPYENPDCLRWLIERTQKTAKRCILIGDVADMFYFAKYMKFRQHYTALEEVMRVQAALNLFSESFEQVVIMPGNHDERFLKYIMRSGIPVEVAAVFEYLLGKHALHPVAVMASHLSNVTVVEAPVLDFAEFGYLYQQGDCVMSHAEKYSKIPNKAVGDVIQSLKSFHEPEGVVQPFRMVIQAHTHQAGKTWNDFGVVGIENGCMALTPDYTGQARSLPQRAPIAGFTELWQTPEGVTDVERTNFVPYPG